MPSSLRRHRRSSRRWSAWLGIGVVWILTSHLTHASPQDAGSRAKRAYARAIELDAKGDASGALALLWEAAALAPRDPDIQTRLGEALERMGALDAAIDAYRLALAERPAFKRASSDLILVLVKAGKGEEAVARARDLVAAAPGDAERQFVLGLAQSEQDVNGAMASFRRALEIDPRHVLARYNLALVLRRADRLDEAIAELTRARAIEPRPEIHYTLGVIYWHQGDLDRAADALRAAIAAEPRYADAYYTLGAVLKAKRNLDDAASALRRAIALRPDLTAAHYTLGQVLAQQGNQQGARDALDNAERLRQRAQKEQEASVLTVVGTERARSGDLVGALDRFRQATTVFEPYAPAHYQMGLVLERLGQPDAARAAFNRARQLNPSLVPPG